MIRPLLKVSTDFGEDGVDDKTLIYNFDDLIKLPLIQMMCDVSHVADVSWMPGCVIVHSVCCVWFCLSAGSESGDAFRLKFTRYGSSEGLMSHVSCLMSHCLMWTVCLFVCLFV